MEKLKSHYMTQVNDPADYAEVVEKLEQLSSIMNAAIKTLDEHPSLRSREEERKINEMIYTCMAVSELSDKEIAEFYCDQADSTPSHKTKAR